LSWLYIRFSEIKKEEFILLFIYLLVTFIVVFLVGIYTEGGLIPSFSAHPPIDLLSDKNNQLISAFKYNKILLHTTKL